MGAGVPFPSQPLTCLCPFPRNVLCLQPVQHAIPQPTGYGDDADSLGSFYRLQPKAPKKNFNKLMERDGEVSPWWCAQRMLVAVVCVRATAPCPSRCRLYWRTVLVPSLVVQVYRFQCRFVRPSPEDEMRRFVIQFYPADDSIAIYEPAIRNSGIMGGKFLSRSTHKKADGCTCCGRVVLICSTVLDGGLLVVAVVDWAVNGCAWCSVNLIVRCWHVCGCVRMHAALFAPEDFPIGGEVEVHGHVFLIEDTDSFTKSQLGLE